MLVPSRITSVIRIERLRDQLSEEAFFVWYSSKDEATIVSRAMDYDSACVLIAGRHKRWLSDGQVGVAIQAA